MGWSGTSSIARQSLHQVSRLALVREGCRMDALRGSSRKVPQGLGLPRDGEEVCPPLGSASSLRPAAVKGSWEGTAPAWPNPREGK